MNEIRNRASAVIIHNDRLLLIHRIKHGQEYWVLPGGGIEPGETSEQAAVREIKEEVGLDVQAKFWYIEDKYNKGGTDSVHVCEVVGSGQVVDHESLQNTDDDWYHVEWVSIAAMLDLNIYPESIKTRITEL